MNSVLHSGRRESFTSTYVFRFQESSRTVIKSAVSQSPSFDDVREIQKALESRGLVLATKADESATGPGSLMVMDPDGNPILVDQHVPSPGK